MWDEIGACGEWARGSHGSFDGKGFSETFLHYTPFCFTLHAPLIQYSKVVRDQFPILRSEHGAF